MPRIRAATIDEHKALNRRALLDAAQRLIEEAGTAEVPLGEIALSAGVGRTTLYEYFADRDDLIATLVEEELPGVISSLIEGIPTDGSPAERLVDLAVATVGFVISDPVLGVILHRETGRLGAEAENRIRAAHSDLSRAMFELYNEAVSIGEMRELPPDLAGRWIQDSIMSTARALISSPDPGRRFDEVALHLRLFLLGGLGVTVG